MATLIEALEERLVPQNTGYIAKPKQGYEPDKLRFHGTPAHPQLRELDFLANAQKSMLQRRTKQGWSNYQSLGFAMALQGVTRSRYELEERIITDLKNFNDLVERMRSEDAGFKMEQRNSPFPVARTDLRQYNDPEALTLFLRKYWDIRDRRNPVDEPTLAKDVERNYAQGLAYGRELFEEEFSRPPYDLIHGARFWKDTKRLIAAAKKALGEGKAR